MSDMGTPGPERQRRRPDQPIVAFDFDGTLTVRDSFTAFLRDQAGPTRWALGLIRLAPALAAYLADRDRGRLKAASVREFLGGLPLATLEAESEAFADKVWTRFMRPDALACWEDWGRRGAYRVIVTASPETTVTPFARRLGADALLGTPLAFDADGRVTGGFARPNCRGEEKVRRLQESFGAPLVLEAAYGDTSGDTEMLAIAKASGFRVFTRSPPKTS